MGSDWNTDLAVWGHTMIGFPGKDMCTYTDWIAISYPLIEDVKTSTSGNEFAMTCGYYVEYEWNGYDDVYFEVDLNNSVVKTISAFAFVALGALFF